LEQSLSRLSVGWKAAEIFQYKRSNSEADRISVLFEQLETMMMCCHGSLYQADSVRSQTIIAKIPQYNLDSITETQFVSSHVYTKNFSCNRYYDSYCRENGFPFIPSPILKRRLEKLMEDHSEVERYHLENEIIDSVS